MHRRVHDEAGMNVCMVTGKAGIARAQRVMHRCVHVEYCMAEAYLASYHGSKGWRRGGGGR